MKTIIFFSLFLVKILLSIIITTSAIKDCKYDKGPWLECDSETGMQKKILRLKTYRAHLPDCLPEKQLVRPCKKQCKYVKGIWSDCINGTKQRIDKLRTDIMKLSSTSSSSPLSMMTTHCKQEKIINKSCRKQCTYSKSEWSQCENGFKNKTLILIDKKFDNTTTSSTTAISLNNECEPIKTIIKPCYYEKDIIVNDNNNNNGNEKMDKLLKKRRKNNKNKIAV